MGSRIRNPTVGVAIMEIGYPTRAGTGDYVDPGQLIIVMSRKEARDLRDAINRAYPVPRGGIAAAVADGITNAIGTGEDSEYEHPGKR